MASIMTADIREYIDSRQKESTVLRKAFTVTARDGTPRNVPEQRRAITGVSNAEINRELTALKRMFNLAISPNPFGRRRRSPISPAGGSTARSCRSSGARSISVPAK